MSRIEDEYIMAVVRNRSGVDSGELDYSIRCSRFDELSVRDLKEVREILCRLSDRVVERIFERLETDERL